MTEFEAAVVCELAGTRVAVERIAAAVDVWLQAPPPETVPQGCEHPDTARVDYGMTNGKPDWECRACGFRSDVTEERTA